METNENEARATLQDQAAGNTGIFRRKSPEIVRSAAMISTGGLPKGAPLDQRMAVLAAAGAYVPQESMAQRVRMKAIARAQAARRSVDVALVVGWVTLAIAAAIILLMILNYLFAGRSTESAARRVAPIDPVSDNIKAFAIDTTHGRAIDRGTSSRGIIHCQ